MISFNSIVQVLFRTTKSPFHHDIAQGLTSSNFDTSVNAQDHHDQRGLDSDDVINIMKEEECSFDEARLLLFYKKCCENNIDPMSGLPLDPKAGFIPFSNKATPLC